jgi:hypothetical protein
MAQVMRKSLWTALVGLAIQSMAGCMNSHAEGEVPPTASETIAHLPTEAVTPAQSSQPAASDGDYPPTVESNTSSPKQAFQPPFPNREELFLPPAEKPAIATRPRSNEDVVLMGFADVEGEKALLKIDGVITPLRAGESRGAVRVLAIDPPRVTLQRGSRQWTERLFDAP